MADADIVAIKTAENDEPTIVHVEDGTIMRHKIDIVEIVRIPDEWDSDGNPLYKVKSGVSLAILDSPDDLRRIYKQEDGHI